VESSLWQSHVDGAKQSFCCRCDWIVSYSKREKEKDKEKKREEEKMQNESTT